MSEADAIRNSKQPVTLNSLKADLEKLGVRAGMVLLVHSSLSALGWVCGGALTVIHALQQVLRPYGTLLMPTHSGGLSDPAAWQHPPVPESWWEIIRQTMPVYNPEETPTRGVGVIPELFRTQIDVLRSSHPHVSFAGWGEKALPILQNHSLEYGLGEGSPLSRLYDLQGWVLLLGADFKSNTTFHLAEYRSKKMAARTMDCYAPVMIENHRRWKRFKDIDFYDEDFDEIGRDFLGHYKSEIVIGTAGYGRAILFPKSSVSTLPQNGWIDTEINSILIAMPGEAEKSTIPVIEEDIFRKLINRRIQEMLCLARFVELYGSGEGCFTRPLLGDLLSESTKMEELLDAYGVRNNRRWLPLRQLVAALKLFSNVAYILLHIEHALPSYRLMKVEENFQNATRQTFMYTSAVVIRILGTLQQRADALDLICQKDAPNTALYAEELPPGVLPDDRVKRIVTSAEETAVYLATAFLNLAEESKVLHTCMKAQKRDYAKFFPDPLSEETLRDLEEKFHNLQSVYDTYISDTNVETLDEDLPVLRGHISVIFHLLETATAFSHYYERHLRIVAKQAKVPKGFIDTRKLLDVLVSYSLVFTSQFLANTRALCHKMLKRYAKLGRVMVNVPKYRGFHVRPSTLISKIVNHYGSEVSMQMDGDRYNAAITLDLFRANEKLNAQKRKRLIAEIHRMPLEDGESQKSDIIKSLLQAIHILQVNNNLVLYQNSPLGEVEPEEGENVYEFAARAITRLLALGKIDTELNAQVTFSGDRRVLADIKLLAENGYGEDNFGNNMDLPTALSYLRR